MIQESVHSEAGATKFDQAKPIAEEGPVLHRPDKARSNSGDAGTGRKPILES